MILSSKNLPRCDSGLPRNTQNCTGIMGNVFGDPTAQKGHPSTIFNNSMNGIFFPGIGTRYCRERKEREKKREPLNTLVQSPHFPKQSGTLDHTGWTYFHGCITMKKISWLWEIPKLEAQLQNSEAQLQNWGLYTNRKSSGHHALDQRSWVCKINKWTCCIAIDYKTT